MGKLAASRADEVVASGAMAAIPGVAAAGINLGQQLMFHTWHISWTTATQIVTATQANAVGDFMVPFNGTIIGFSESVITQPTATNCSLKISSATGNKFFLRGYSTNLVGGTLSGALDLGTTATYVLSTSISAGDILRIEVPISGANTGDVALTVFFVPRV